MMRGWSGPEFHKIGCTGNVYRRYGAKRVRDKIVAFVPIPADVNIYEAERQVHDFFRDRWYSSELFILSKNDLRLVKLISFELGRLKVGVSDGDQALSEMRERLVLSR